MKIGFKNIGASINYSAGINVQGRMWAEGLTALGHECILINEWDKIDYNSLDFIILLGTQHFYDYIQLYSRFSHPKIVLAPIIDYNGSLSTLKLKAKYFGSMKFKIRKPFHDIYMLKDKVNIFLARSEYEKDIIKMVFNLPENKVFIVPISMRYSNIAPVDMSIKEDYCLHMSRLADPGKNVKNLILAAKKYGFKLKLGGTINGKEKEWLDNQIKDASNIEYLGWLTEEQLAETYKRAKVFALPSFVEGVGMVALEAAVYGAEIVLTDIGAPKEYYNGRAVLVSPADVDSIGKGVIEAMTSKKSQPELRQHILDNYTLPINMKQLENIFHKHLKE